MDKRLRPRIRRHGEDGQGLVELALVLPIFALVIFALFDVGRLVYTNSVLSQAAREGARLAAVEAGVIGLSGSLPSCEAARVCPTTVGDFKADVVGAVNRMTASLGAITAVHVSCNDGSVGDPAPSGEWTDGSGGNGCSDGAGTAIGASGELVSVRVEYTYQPITPIVSSLVAPVPLSGAATMVIH